jgi:hypothetical protein
MGALAALVVACRAGEERPATTTTTAAQVANEDAINKITKARCDREESCNNVGTGKHYDDRDACTRELAHDARADLRAERCGVIDPQKLDKCLSAIGDERCGNPLDAMSRLAACRQNQLCLQK